jgi:hypothetical protein
VDGSSRPPEIIYVHSDIHRRHCYRCGHSRHVGLYCRASTHLPGTEALWSTLVLPPPPPCPPASPQRSPSPAPASEAPLPLAADLIAQVFDSPVVSATVVRPADLPAAPRRPVVPMPGTVAGGPAGGAGGGGGRGAGARVLLPSNG